MVKTLAFFRLSSVMLSINVPRSNECGLLIGVHAAVTVTGSDSN